MTKCLPQNLAAPSPNPSPADRGGRFGVGSTLFTRNLLAVTVCSAIAGSAWGQSERVVSASFFDPGNSDTGPLLSTSIAGVPAFQYTVPTEIRVDNWNNLDALYPVVSGSKLDLIDSQGLITSVDASWIATDVSSNDWGGGILSGDSTMMNGHLQSWTLGAQGLITVTVRDLANTFDLGAGYEVIVYADAEWMGSEQSLLVDDGIHVAMAQTMLDNVAAIPAGRPFDAPVDYDEGTTDLRGVWARFPGLTGPSFTIEAMATRADEAAFLNGFQIVGYQQATRDPGDLDANGLVNGEDLLLWQVGYSAGKFSSKHLAAWQASLGASPAAAVAGAIPEPGAGALLMFAAAIGAVRMRNFCGIRRTATGDIFAT